VEQQMAEKIAHLFPSIEKVRLVNSGTEATMTAMRLARGFTERPKILKFTGHYHGHADSLLVQAGSHALHINPIATSKGVNASVVADTICLPFNDFEAVRRFFRTNAWAEQLAAVIVEPIAANMGVVLPERGFLQMLREETARVGTLLIFDEIITGFRVGLQGAQGLYGIRADLTCLGKIVGGGFPLAAVGGRGEIMDFLSPIGQVYQAGTLSGNPVAVCAGLATLAHLEAPHFFEELSAKTDLFLKPIEEALDGKNGVIHRVGSMFTLFFGVKEVRCKEDLKHLDEKLFAQFFRFLFQRGIYIPPSSHEAWFLSTAHTEEHKTYTARAICEFIGKYSMF
jgi:glutamate-1-semialdehyde 2,1-aminomutase